MEQGSDRPLVADEIRRLTERLGIIEALMTAFDKPHEVLQLLLDADDVHQAHAVLDAQFRRTTKLDRRRIVQQRDELVRELQHLRSLPPEP